MAVDFASDRSPAEQGRGRTCQSTNNDILRRRTLEKHGVDKRIAHQGSQCEPSGKRVNPDDEDIQAHPAQGHSKQRRLQIRHPTLSNGTVVRAGHFLVYLLVDQVIDRCRRARAKANTQIAQHQNMQWHHARNRHKHADGRGENHQKNHIGLRELFIVAPSGGACLP